MMQAGNVCQEKIESRISRVTTEYTLKTNDRVELAVDKERGDQQRNAQDIPAGDVERGSEVSVLGEYAHVLVAKQVH